MYPNRTMCSVLEEMRECYKTRNFSYLLGLIEEAQTLANRMESGLGDKRDYYSQARTLRDIIKQIKKEREETVENAGVFIDE